MLARELLKKCLNCKNNIECFGLSGESKIEGKNSKEIQINVDAYSKNLLKMNPESLHDAHVAATVMYIRTLYVKPVGINDILNTSMCVVEALTNSSNADWDCPSEWEYVSK